MITVDASVWLGYALPNDRNHAVSSAWLMEYLSGSGLIAAPFLLTTEVAGAVARQTGDSQLGRQLAQEIFNLSNVRLVSLDPADWPGVAMLAADLKLRGADATYVFVARDLGTPLITWDEEQLTRGAAVVETRRPT